MGRTLFAGGMAGAADCIVGMPADVIKSILQTGVFIFVYGTRTCVSASIMRAL